MTDLKRFSELTYLTAVNAADADIIPIVDISEGETEAASRVMTVAELYKLLVPVTVKAVDLSATTDIVFTYETRVDITPDSSAKVVTSISAGKYGGQLLVIRLVAEDNTVKIPNSLGNVQLSGDWFVQQIGACLILKYNAAGMSWEEIGRFDGENDGASLHSLVTGYKSSTTHAYQKAHGADEFAADDPVAGDLVGVRNEIALYFNKTSIADPAPPEDDLDINLPSQFTFPDEYSFAFELLLHIIPQGHGANTVVAKRMGYIYRTGGGAPVCSSLQTIGTDIDSGGYITAITMEDDGSDKIWPVLQYSALPACRVQVIVRGSFVKYE